MDDSKLLYTTTRLGENSETIRAKESVETSHSSFDSAYATVTVGGSRTRRRSSLPDGIKAKNIQTSSERPGNMDTMLPERPASSIPPSYHPGFDELFPAVVPPQRPLTASPQRPHQPTARRTSEAVALERIFSNFSLPPSPEPIIPEEPHPQPVNRPFTPTGAAASAIVDNDVSFRADLANVLVWFEQDLTNSQRITTAFTLLNHLTTWQLRFLLSLLSRPSEDFQAEAQLLHHPEPLLNNMPLLAHNAPVHQEGPATPPGFERQQPSPSRPQSPSITQARRSPLPAAFKSYRNTSASPAPSNSNGSSFTALSPTLSSSAVSGTSSVASELTLEQCSPELFDRDLGAWLRSLRLHKYSPILSGISQSELLKLPAMEQTEAETRLEQLGVGALGARRKILRVLSIIRANR